MSKCQFYLTIKYLLFDVFLNVSRKSKMLRKMHASSDQCYKGFMFVVIYYRRRLLRLATGVGIIKRSVANLVNDIKLLTRKLL